MRRYVFYLSVALLALGIGASSVYFYQMREVVNESPKYTKEKISRIITSPEKAEKPALRREFLTDKEKALFLFEPTLDKWLKKQKIEDNVEPSPQIIQKITQSNLIYADEQGLIQNAEKNYKPTLIDVNDDGKDELAILSNCSPTEFCQFWIFEKTKDDFNVILNTYQEVENFKLQKSKVNGYFNIETTHTYPKSLTSLGMKVYKFHGKEYSVSDCFDYEYRYMDKTGKLDNLKEPKFHSLHCC